MTEVSKLREIGDQRRAELAAKNRYAQTNKEYNKTSPDIFSEGVGGDNYGKDPQTPPANITDAYKTIGGKDDIVARIGATSPGSLSKNEYWAGGNQYDNVI
jgi:hypothetical protein